MTYNLLVFSPRAAPQNAADFLTWYHEQIEWPEPHSYEDPAITTLPLKAWVLDMMCYFPPKSGPYQEATSPDDKSTLADYSIGREMVFTAFDPLQMAYAKQWAHRLAALRCVGLFEVSEADQFVWLPNGNSGLRVAFNCTTSAIGAW